MLDKLNQEILKRANGKPAKAVSEVIQPFLGQKSDRALRDRLRQLERVGLIKLEKHPNCVLVKVTRKGHAEARAAQGGEPHGY